MANAPSPPNVEHHQQEEDTYCGAACAQMLLHSFGFGLSNPAIDQFLLFNQNNGMSNDHQTDWGVAPDELILTLQAVLKTVQSATERVFEFVVADTEQEITRRIIWTLFNKRAAPVAVVLHGAHWVVVVDYMISKDPIDDTDSSYAINDLIVQDPSPALLVDKNPPPHQTGDLCGTGSANTNGLAIGQIPYAIWQQQYMTPVDKGCWLGKYIAVLEKDPLVAPQPEPPCINSDMSLRARAMQADAVPGPGAPEGAPGDVRPLLKIPEAQKYAVEGLRQFDLYNREPWSTLLKDTAPDIPIPVERLDYPGRFYYIVPMKVQEGPGAPVAVIPGAPVAVIIDARTGAYEQAAAVRERRMTVMPPIPDRATLVWEPSVESFLPFYPFVRSTDPNRPGLYRLGNPEQIFREPKRDVLGF